MLDVLAKIGLRELQSCGVFTVPYLANLKVHCVKTVPFRTCIARMSLSGKKYYARKPSDGKRVMAIPALKLRRSIEGNKFGTALAIEDGVCSDSGQ